MAGGHTVLLWAFKMLRQKCDLGLLLFKPVPTPSHGTLECNNWSSTKSEMTSSTYLTEKNSE